MSRKFSLDDLALGLVGLLFRDPKPVRRRESPMTETKIDIPVTAPGQVELLGSGNIRLTIDDYVITESVLDRGYFVDEWFTNEELEIIAKYERHIQNLMKSQGPRKYSGMYAYSHIDNVLRLIFDFATQTNPETDEASTKLRLSTILGAIGHDSQEDDLRYKKILKEWYDAVERGDHKARRQIADQLAQLRILMRNETKDLLLSYLNELGVRATEYERTKRNILDAVHLMYSLTRFANEEAYVVSMGKVYRRVKHDNPLKLFERMLIKNADRLANLTEVEPLDRATMHHINTALNDPTKISESTQATSQDTIGQRLTDRYGDVNTKAEAMSRAARLLTAGKSIFPFEYSAQSINGHRTYVEGGREYQEGTNAYLGLALLSRDKMINATLALLKAAIEMYEADDSIIAIKDRTDRQIADRRETDSTYFDRATNGGSVERLMRYDIAGASLIESIDNKDPTRRERNYLMARELLELVENYRQRDGARLWTLQDFDKLIALQPDLWGSYREIRGRYQSSTNDGRVTPSRFPSLL